MKNLAHALAVTGILAWVGVDASAAPSTIRHLVPVNPDTTATLNGGQTFFYGFNVDPTHAAVNLDGVAAADGGDFSAQNAPTVNQGQLLARDIPGQDRVMLDGGQAGGLWSATIRSAGSFTVEARVNIPATPAEPTGSIGAGGFELGGFKLSIGHTAVSLISAQGGVTVLKSGLDNTGWHVWRVGYVAAGVDKGWWIWRNGVRMNSRPIAVTTTPEGAAGGFGRFDSRQSGHWELDYLSFDKGGAFAPNTAGAPDSDGDGMGNEWEMYFGLNPNSAADAATDLDNDGLTNLQEFQLGTDPTNPDSDGDGLNDSTELTTPSGVLKANFPLDEGTGTLAADVVGGLNGALSGNPAWTTAGKYDKALTFDGIDDYVGIPALNLNSNHITITGWVKRNGAQSDWAGLAFCRGGTTVSGLSILSTGELVYDWADMPESYNFSTGLVIPDNAWTFVAMVIEPDRATFYMKDGAGLHSAVNQISHAVLAFDGETRLGNDSWDPARSFKGAIDDVRIYAAAVSAASILAIADRTFVPGLDPLSPDTDADGLNDGQEIALGTKPGIADSDGDGLSDGDEVNLYHTNPLVADSDHDGLADGQEIALGTNPMAADTDGDGFPDGQEVAIGTDPKNPPVPLAVKRRLAGANLDTTTLLNNGDTSFYGFNNDPTAAAVNLDGVAAPGSGDFRPLNQPAFDTARGIAAYVASKPYVMLDGNFTGSLWQSTIRPAGSFTVETRLYVSPDGLEGGTGVAGFDFGNFQISIGRTAVYGKVTQAPMPVIKSGMDNTGWHFWRLAYSATGASQGWWLWRDGVLVGPGVMHPEIAPSATCSFGKYDWLQNGAWEADYLSFDKGGAFAPAGYPATADTDGDGMSDAYETMFGLNPNDPADASLDTDNDGLTNLQESAQWTDPAVADTDGDGLNDATDNDPLSRASILWGLAARSNGDQYKYTGPAWWVGATKTGGEWLDSAWHVAADADNGVGCLNIDLDRALLGSDLRMDLELDDSGSLQVELLDAAAAVLHTIPLTTNGSGMKITPTVTIPLVQFTTATRIRLHRISGAVTVSKTILFIDNDNDGLDAAQERQFGSSDALADSDGDGVNDRTEALEAKTNPVSLPAGMSACDIGAAYRPGQISFVNGSYSIQRTGGWLAGTADYGTFVWKDIFGDCDMIVHVDDIGFPGYDSMLGGIQFRESLAPGARQVSLTHGGNWVCRLRARLQTNADTPVLQYHWVAEQRSGWLRISRKGDIFTCSYGTDAKHWQILGTLTVPMAASIKAGIFTAAESALHNVPFKYSGLAIDTNPDPDHDGLLSYDEVNLHGTNPNLADSDGDGISDGDEVAASSDPNTYTGTIDGGWFWQTIGTAPQPGGVTLNNGLWQLTTYGYDLWGTRDQITYAYRPLEGNGELIAKMDGFATGRGEGGVMIRANLLDSSPYCALSIHRDGILIFTSRQVQEGGSLVNYFRQVGDPAWLRIRRQGGVISTSWSKDGKNWQEATTQKLDISGRVWIGLAATTQGRPAPVIAKFSNVSFYANADSDNDGLADYDETNLYGTNPALADSDGDGWSDYEEVTRLHTNPAVAEFDGTSTTIASVSGSSGRVLAGNWHSEGTAIVADTRQGRLEYTVNLATAGIYVLDVAATQGYPGIASCNFPLTVAVDGIDAGTTTLESNAATGTASFFLPNLAAGQHTVTVQWTNVQPRSILRINSLAVKSLGGVDANANGIPDWQETRAATFNGLKPNLPATSVTSPFCIEGFGGFTNAIQVLGAYVPVGNQATLVDGKLPAGVAALPRTNWFANVELDPAGTATAIDCRFQNGLATVNHSVTWTATNVMQTTAITIRRGDSLRLGAVPENAAAGTFQIEVEGQTLTPAAGQDAAPWRFDNAGDIAVVAVFTPANGSAVIQKTMTVKVVAADFNSTPYVVVGGYRSWDNPAVAREAVLEADTYLAFGSQTLAPAGVRIDCALYENRPAMIAARLGAEGPVLDVATVRPIIYYSTSLEHFTSIETYADGSQLIEGALYFNEVPADFSVKLDIFVGGVTFEDGTLTKTITANMVGPNGELRFRFVRSRDAWYSTCHYTSFFQNGVAIGVGGQ